MSNRPPLAAAQEVADYLRVPPKTLTQWRYLGKGPPYLKLGTHVRYRWADVERWVSDRQRQQT